MLPATLSLFFSTSSQESQVDGFVFSQDLTYFYVIGDVSHTGYQYLSGRTWNIIVPPITNAFSADDAVYRSLVDTGTPDELNYGLVDGNPVLSVDVRYDITSAVDIAELATWIEHTKFTGFTIALAVSIVGSGDDENFVDLTESVIDLSSTVQETSGTYTATADTKITLRITMTRNATGDSVKLTKVLGAIGE